MDYCTFMSVASGFLADGLIAFSCNPLANAKCKVARGVTMHS
jgi:hypothetical protein